MSVYGADLDKWPRELRSEAEKSIQASSELAELLRAEKELESALMERTFEESSPGLSYRIISRALGQQGKNQEKEKQKSLLGSIKELFTAFPLPSPAIALPVILVIGIVAGYLYPAEEAMSEPEGTQVAEFIYNDWGLYE